MWMQMLRATGFKRFASFVSPAFFEVVPTRAMLGRARTLISAYRDSLAFEAAREARAAALPATLGVSVVEAVSGERPTAVEDRRRLGEVVLRVYFHQLIVGGPTLIDLSRRRFGFDGPVGWTPGPGHVEWDDDFRAAMVRVYRGFYGDDAGQMQAGLDALGLASAADLFRQHFGEGDQTAVAFSVEHFVSSFHAVFLHCKEAGIRLHPDFLPLGIYLATLYENLAGLDVPLDVRSAYAAAERAST